jgi:hypothetical protein
MFPRARDEVGFSGVHQGHVFDGFEIVERPPAPDVVVARCECGAVLYVARASYATCPECSAGVATGGAVCLRCGGNGKVIDHARLRWRSPEEAEVAGASTS